MAFDVVSPRRTRMSTMIQRPFANQVRAALRVALPVMLGVGHLCTVSAQESSLDTKEAADVTSVRAGPDGNVARDLEFTRIRYNESNQPVALEVAIVRMASQSPSVPEIEVDLAGAVHVADKAYYEQLNKRFTHYDAVLYELVAEEGTRIPLGGADDPGNPISILQGGMTHALGLTFQLDEIDYTRPNLVHADMTPEEFAESRRRRKESIAKTFFRAIGQAMVEQGSDPLRARELQLFKALVAENREHELKCVLAEEFADLDGIMAVYETKDGSTLVTERNKKALSVLRREIDSGRRRLAIFYGAAHMSDMAARLRKDFGFSPVKTEWIVAWDLSSNSTK